MQIIVGLGILNRSKNDQGGACLAADRSYSQVLARRLARRLA